MDYGYSDKSLSKHKISRLEVNKILDVNNTTRRDFDLPLSSSGNLRIMFVGYNHAGRLLEIAVEFTSENRAYVFHGQSISPSYRKLYEERITHE